MFGGGGLIVSSARHSGATSGSSGPEVGLLAPLVGSRPTVWGLLDQA
jgi:hypothetical protein